MADIESNVKVNIDTSDALTQLKLLQQQISAFQQAMRKAGADNANAARQMQQNLVNSINATGKFQANIQTIQTSAERFTSALEKNKLTMGEYFRYAGGASKSFGKLFKSEFETINQVARERVKDLQTQYIKLGRDANGAMKAIAVKPLALDMESLATKTQIAAQKQQLFNQLMKQGSTNLLNFGKNTQWAGRQLMVGFTVPLVMMGSAAAKSYMEIEKASIAFKRVYGDINTTANETEKMANNVRALATEFTKYGVAVADTMDMAAKAAAMGKTGADLLAQVNQANKLAVLGQVDQQQALDTTISLTNAFGLATEDLAGKIDFLNAVENQTVTSIEDLTIAIPKAAPVIQQLGGNVEDLTFFLTAMREGGINASEGANALKSGLASMINPTGKANEFLKSFGINLKAIVETNKGDVKGTVINFAKALDTLDPLNRARAIEQLFGKFQFSRISTLFKNVIDEGSQANKVAGLAKETAQELAILSERELKKVSDSPMYKFQKSVEEMKSKLAPVGEAFLKAVTPVVELVGRILDGFNGLSDGAKQFASIATIAIAGIGPILLMTFGLIANGVANIMKMFVNLKSFFNKTGNKTNILGEQTSYMNTEQLRGAAIAASLDQAHAKLRQTFTSEAAAVDALTQAYKRAVTAQGAYAGVPGVPVGGAAKNPRKYANGVSMVPGPAGAGDIVPALLSPGEAVIPAKHARKYAPVIAGMVSGNLPGFENGTTGVGMRQSIIGPLTQKQTDGMARTALQLDEISKNVMIGPYGKVMPNNYGVQVSPSTGHSFPAFGVGGVYKKPDGTSVFVKPQISLETALAEMRGTEIARSAHGLEAPKQKIGVMMDPTDPQNQRRFIVLESPVDEKFSNIPTKFTKNQYFKQLVASLLRGDKDLGLGNLGGNVLADVGPAGVFQRASGKRELGSKINSMEEQAIINLLGVKGGAKRFFAESTSDIVKKMTPAQYDAAMKTEIQGVMPKLQSTIAGFGKLNPMEKKAYMQMQQRLQAGMGVDWGKYQVMHSAVPPKKYNDGIEEVPGKKSKGGRPKDAVAAMRALSQAEIRKMLNIEDTHITLDLDTKDKKVLKQIKDVYPKITEEELAIQSARSNLTAQLPGNLNQRMRRGASGWRSPIFGNVWNGFRGKLSKIASMHGMEIPSLQAVEDEIGAELAKLPLANDEEVGKKVQEVLQKKLSPEEDPDGVYKQLWTQAQTVGTMRTDLKGPNGSMSETDALLRQLQLGVASWRQTRGKGQGPAGWEIMNASKTQRIGGFAIDQIASGPGFTREEKDSLRLEARLAAERWIAGGNWNAPLPIVQSKPTAKPGIYKIDSKTKLPRISPDTGKEMLNTGWKQLSLVGKDAATGKFSTRGRKQGGVGVIAYDDSFLKTAPQTNLGFAVNREQQLYDTLMENGAELVPPGYRAKFAAFSSQGTRNNKVPGYANGVFSVPGPKGAGDIVPAMLSPGEAVIPAKQAGKHRGLISQMISGKLPGYNKGTVRVPGYVFGEDNVQKIPGVTAPTPIASSEPSSGGMKGFVSSIADSAKKMADAAVTSSKQAATVVGGKVKSAADTVGYNVVDRFLNPNDEALQDGKGVVRNKGRVEARLAKEAAEKKALQGQATSIGKDISKRLEANDTEYVMAKKRVEELGILNEQQGGLDKLQKEEMTAKKTLMQAKRDALRQEIMEERKEAGTLLSPTAKKGTPEYREQQKEKKADRNASIQAASGKLTQLGFTASMAAGAMSMIPGPIGQMSQTIMPAIAGLSTLAGFVQGPISAVVVGLVAVLGSMYLAVTELNKQFNENVIAAQKNKEAVGGSTQAIRKLSEFTKTVTAGELMDKVRASRLVGINAAQGKTTFGESYVKSEQGQAFIKNFKEQIKERGGITSSLISDYANQLTVAVASGALDEKQAASIAANVGAALGDSDFAFKVRALIGQVIGPDGKDIKKDPVKVAAILQARSIETIKADRKNLESVMDKDKLPLGLDNTEAARTGITIGSGVLGGAVGGAVGLGVGVLAANLAAGALAGTAMAASLGAIATFAGPIGLVAGAVGAVYLAYTAMVDAQKRAGAAAGAMLADMSMALQQQKEMGDVLDKYYLKKIAEAKAENDITEQKRLQLEYDQKRNKLAEINKVLLETIMSEYNAADATTREALRAGADTALQAKYKDNPEQLMYMDLIKKRFEDVMGAGFMQGDQKILLQTQMISGNMQPGDMTKLLALMTDKEMTTKVMSIVTDFGAVTAQEFSQTVGMIKSESVRKEVTIAVSRASTSEEALEILDLVRKIEQFGGVINADMYVSYFQKNRTEADGLRELLASFEQKGNKLDAKVAMTIDTELLAGQNFDPEYFDSLKEVDKNQYLQVLESIIKIPAPLVIADDDYKRWLNDEGAKLTPPPGGGSDLWWAGQYAMQRAYKVTTEMRASDLLIGGGEEKKEAPAAPDASFLDPYVKTLREATRLQQGITVGWKDSLAALKTYSAATISAFSGQAVLLQKAGASEGLIQAFLGGSEEDQNRMFAKAKGGISDVGKFIIAQAKRVEDAKFGLDYILAGVTGRLEKDNELYQAGLDVISNQEKKINEKYDKRLKTLDEIGKVQEKNNQREQDTLELADALSKGDIAAAARAALKARQNQQKQALENTRAALENARKNELDSVTTTILGKTVRRDELEAKIAVNAEKIAISKKNELDHQISIGRHAVATANSVAGTLTTLKGIAGIKLPTIKASTIDTNTINTNDINNSGDDGEEDGETETGKTKAEVLSGLKGIQNISNTQAGPLIASGIAGITSGSKKTSEINAGEKAMTTAKSKLTAMFVGNDTDVDQTNMANLLASGAELTTQDISNMKALRVRLDGDDRAIFDTEFANLQAATARVAAAESSNFKETETNKIFKTLPQAAQDAITLLKTLKEPRETYAAPYRDAKKVYADWIKNDAGEDRNAWQPKDFEKEKDLLAIISDKYKAFQTYEKKNITPIKDALAGKGVTASMVKFFTGYARGGMVYANNGLHVEASKYALGTDTIPAMLTPGEFVMRKAAVDAIGADKLMSMNNNATSVGESVYNYSITVNATGNFDSNDLARKVIDEIKRVDSQRIRSNNY